MDISNKISVGTHVTLVSKNGKIIKGIVKRILRNFQGEILVELIDGSIGHVKNITIKRPTLKEIKEAKENLIKQPKRILIKQPSMRIDEFTKESNLIEYKESALWSQNLSKNELDSSLSPEIKKYGNKASKVIIAKSIASFLNTNGGVLFIGIKENKTDSRPNEIIGIEKEFNLLKNNDPGEDGYRRMITADIIKPFFPKTIFNHLNSYINISFPKVNGKTICQINIKKSDHEIFLEINSNDYFFIRVDTETRELQGKQVVDYIKKVFS